MNLQADLKWIINELLQVKDPTFIEAIKNMLKYRELVNKGLTKLQKEEELLIEEAESDIQSGNVYTIDEARKIIENWEL